MQEIFIVTGKNGSPDASRSWVVQAFAAEDLAQQQVDRLNGVAVREGVFRARANVHLDLTAAQLSQAEEALRFHGDARPLLGASGVVYRYEPLSLLHALPLLETAESC